MSVAEQTNLPGYSLLTSVLAKFRKSTELFISGHQLPHRLCDRPRLPGVECRGAGEAEGGVEGRAEEDGGGDIDIETGSDSQGETRSR